MHLAYLSLQVAHDHGIPLIVDNTFGMGGKPPSIVVDMTIIKHAILLKAISCNLSNMVRIL
jgi:hypothetical protein